MSNLKHRYTILLLLLIDADAAANSVSGQVDDSSIDFEDSTATSFATLTWRPPAQNKESPLMGYIVEYRESTKHTWERLNKYLVPGTACLVDGLIPSGKYQFRVIAEYMDEKGPPSESLQGKLWQA